jgi:hypothetical protein
MRTRCIQNLVEQQWRRRVPVSKLAEGSQCKMPHHTVVVVDSRSVDQFRNGACLILLGERIEGNERQIEMDQ